MLRPICNDEDRARAMTRMDQLMTNDLNNDELAELEALSLLVENYEAKFHPMAKPTAREALKFRMDQMGMNLEEFLHHYGVVEIRDFMDGVAELTLDQIKRLHKIFNISYEILIDH